MFLRILSYKLVRYIILICETGMLLQPAISHSSSRSSNNTSTNIKKTVQKKGKSYLSLNMAYTQICKTSTQTPSHYNRLNCPFKSCQGVLVLLCHLEAGSTQKQLKIQTSFDKNWYWVSLSGCCLNLEFLCNPFLCSM